jgi:AraC family transcriptional regulator of adaptative response / DNA-3-methyladenine glycosylase II
VPGCWDGFELAVRAVLGQQVSVSGASTLAGRLVRRFGKQISNQGPLTHLFPPARVLLEADIACIGVTGARAETIRALSRSVAEDQIKLSSLQDFDDVRARLMQLPGIGDWTTQYIAMRALGDPDAFPAGDLGLRRALSINSAREITRRAEVWRPWRAYAAIYLWEDMKTATKRMAQLRESRTQPTTASQISPTVI